MKRSNSYEQLLIVSSLKMMIYKQREAEECMEDAHLSSYPVIASLSANQTFHCATAAATAAPVRCESHASEVQWLSYTTQNSTPCIVAC